MTLYLECPECYTKYTTERCGVKVQPEKPSVATVVCPICACSFDARIEFVPARTEILNEPGWFAKYVLRRQAQFTEVPGRYDVTSRKR